MSERAMSADGQAKPYVAAAESTSEAGVWARHGKYLTVFALLMLGYMLSFSFDENDSLDTANWMEAGNIRPLLEFRHLIQRMLPLWLWMGLQALGIKIPALALLDLWDFITGALSVMLLYRFLRELTESRAITYWSTFAYATAHCVWIYTGSGRMYSTSNLLVFAAFYLALHMSRSSSELARYVLALGAATYVCFAGLFWLVHVFSGISVGLLLVLLPAGPWLRRLSYATVFGVFGLALTLVIAVSCLTYVQIPLEVPAVRAWIAAAGTQPMTFDLLSPMKASFGHAHGILNMYPLPFMINGLMVKDPKLLQLASLPWNLTKFFLVWMLLTLVYVYPLLLLWKADRQRRVWIALLYLPLAINMYFAMGWLGSDVQRFMPTMLSQFALAAFSVQDLLRRVRKPRRVAVALCVCLLFIAGSNFIESILPSQRAHIALAAAMRSIRPYTRQGDVMLNFGRDLPISYQTATRYYGGARALTSTNDVTKYNWDRTDWRDEIERIRRQAEAGGGRLLVMDRLAMGWNPVSAAWSEVHHPNPTVAQFSEYLRTQYCVTPAVHAGLETYYQVAERTEACPSYALPGPVENLP